jgi:hypothetical protein
MFGGMVVVGVCLRLLRLFYDRYLGDCGWALSSVLRMARAVVGAGWPHPSRLACLLNASCSPCPLASAFLCVRKCWPSSFPPCSPLDYTSLQVPLAQALSIRGCHLTLQGTGGGFWGGGRGSQ